ncbi:MAG TPA: hypothetical protein VK558_04795 [Patescibacteria group bacterium]|nr:hypothetical protein [Patescibacteria group bacterium]
MMSLLSRRSIQGLSLAVALCFALLPSTVEAKGGFSSSSSRSSSSYSSKSSSGGGYGSPSLGASSKPSSSGYGSPSLSATAPAAGGSLSGLGSANDKAVSQQTSKASLDAYKASKAPAAPTSNWQPRPDTAWSRPSYVPATPPYYGSGSSGISGIVWWMMIENLADHAVMATLMSHRDSDDYRAWRREADQQAATNAELRGRLDEMDHKLAEEGPQATALASPAEPEPHPFRNILWFVVIGGGAYGAFRFFSGRRA